MTWLLALLSSAALAVENLDGCETALAVTKTRRLDLRADQIAVRGPLAALTDVAAGEKPTWAVIDEFVHLEVAPGRDTSIHPLRPGDYVFVLDPQSTIVAEGIFLEHPGGPRLVTADDSRSPALPDDEFRAHFDGGSPAVVLSTLDPTTRKRLEARLEPWLVRHRVISAGDPRRQTFGNHVVDPKSFEEVLRGRVDFEPRPTLLAGDRSVEFRAGERVLLLDRRQRVLDDFRLDVTSSDHEAKLRAAHEVVLVRPIF